MWYIIGAFIIAAIILIAFAVASGRVAGDADDRAGCERG